MNELSVISQCFAQARRVATSCPIYIEKFKGIPIDTMMTKEQDQKIKPNDAWG